MIRPILLGAALLSLSSVAFGQTAKIFRGEVSDSQCALNVQSLTRSRQEMLESKSMDGTSNTCAVYCIEHLGGYLVLSSGKNVYRLDRADLVHGFEGRRVVITACSTQDSTRFTCSRSIWKRSRSFPHGLGHHENAKDRHLRFDRLPVPWSGKYNVVNGRQQQ